MSLKLLTYATPEFELNARDFCKSAIDVGFAAASLITPSDISDTAFYQDNRDLFSRARGAGYWLWKPYIIIQELKRCRPGDIVLYSDAGRTSYYQFSKFPQQLVKACLQSSEGFLLGPSVPHLGNLRRWTKRDCFILMGADRKEVSDRPAIVTWSLWRSTPNAFEFLEKWLEYCLDRRCLTDDPNSCGLPNYEEFQDHRHDMSILSILAYRDGAPFLDFSNTAVQKMIDWRPFSSVGGNFYKRPGNVDDLMRRDSPFLVIREHFRLKRLS